MTKLYSQTDNVTREGDFPVTMRFNVNRLESIEK